MELGGDGIYAAWQLTYLEPALRTLKDYQKGYPINGRLYKGKLQKFEPGLCPTAETIQPKLLQLKTNYWDIKVAEAKEEALAKTIAYFGK